MEYPVDHRRIFSAITPSMALPPTSLWSNAGDYFDRATAFAAGFNVDKVNWCKASREGALGYVEDPLQALDPSHWSPALGGGL